MAVSKISPISVGTIQAIVTNWLEQHVPGQTIVVDDDLTMSQAAADAKVTGDAIRGFYITADNAGNITFHQGVI